MPLLPFGSAPQIHPVPISQGGTGSSTQNFADLSSTQIIGGVKTFSSNIILSGNANTSKAFKPITGNTYELGDPGAYWQYIYGSRLYLNSTTNFDGGTAGWASLTGALAVGAASDPLSWAGLYTVNGFRADNDFRFQKASGAQYISRLNGSGSGSASGYDLVFQVHDDNITLFGAGGLIINNAASSANYFQVNGGTHTNSFGVDTAGNVNIGNAALATTATDGFLYIPTTAGAPTGTPTSKTGLVPLAYDTTDNKLYVYNGAWKAVTLA